MRVLEETENAEAKTVGFSAKDELLNLLGAVRRKQIVLLDRSRILKKQLQKKLKRIQWWRKVSTIMFAIGFFTVPVLAALAMIVPVPSAIEVLVGAFSATIGSIGKWWVYLWNKREVAAAFQKDGIEKILMSSYILLHDMDNMQDHSRRGRSSMEPCCFWEIKKRYPNNHPRKEQLDGYFHVISISSRRATNFTS